MVKKWIKSIVIEIALEYILPLLRQWLEEQSQEDIDARVEVGIGKVLQRFDIKPK